MTTVFLALSAASPSVTTHHRGQLSSPRSSERVYSVDDTGRPLTNALIVLAQRTLDAAQDHSIAGIDAVIKTTSLNKTLARPGVLASIVKVLADSHGGSENCEYFWPGFLSLGFHKETQRDVDDAKALGVDNVENYHGVIVIIGDCGMPTVPGLQVSISVPAPQKSSPTAADLKGMGGLVGNYYVHAGSLVIHSSGIALLSAPDESLNNVSVAASVFSLRLKLKRVGVDTAVATVLSSTTPKVTRGAHFTIILHFPGVIIRGLSLASEFCVLPKNYGLCGA